MNTGTERAAIESIYASFEPIRLEYGQRFTDEDGVELNLVGISRADFIGGACGGPVAVLSRSGLKDGINRPSFRVEDCAGIVIVRPQSGSERSAECIGGGLAPRFVAESVHAIGFDSDGRCVVRRTGVKVSYPLLISAGVND
jgi:hypothetical protein